MDKAKDFLAKKATSVMDTKIYWSWLLFAAGLLALIPSSIGVGTFDKVKGKKTTEETNNYRFQIFLTTVSAASVLIGIILLYFQYIRNRTPSS